MKNLRYFRKIIFFALLFLLPFNTRYILNYEAIKNLQYFHENITFFLSPFDIGILLIISTFIWEKFKEIKKNFLLNKNLYYASFLLFFSLIISTFFSDNRTVAFYNIIRIIEAIIFFFIAKEILSQDARNFLQGVYLIFVAGIFQSIIAILQFISQKSVGLFVIGESYLSPQLLGVAKIEHAGEKLIRGYGTFSHPNVLGAFLLFSVTCGIFLLVHKKRESIFNQKRKKDWLSFVKKIIRFFKIENFSMWEFHLVIGLMLIILGIILTFSRIAWAGLVIITVFAFLKWVIVNRHRFPIFNYSFYERKTPKEKISISPEQKLLLRDTFFLGTLYIIIIAIFLLPLMTNRTCVRNCEYGNDSYQIRKEYLNTASNIIKDNPMMGVGSGNFVIKMEEYAKTDFQEWEKQPVHSLYFLITSEIGIIGLIILVYFVIYNMTDFPFKRLFGVLFSTYLFLGIFDHFFASIFQGQLLFWSCLAFFTSSCNIERKDKKFDNF